MDLFKLFYDHDLRLDEAAKRNANRSKKETEATLADFMSPTPTYSKFYLTGTRLDEEQFGLNILVSYEQVIAQLDKRLRPSSYFTSRGQFEKLSEALSSMDIGEVVIASDTKVPEHLFSQLRIDEESNVGHRHGPLKKALEDGRCVIYKEQAHHGYDLHLFSMPNIYLEMFKAFQPLVEGGFRFFSINSKRMRSERHFYFETWTLDRPPHGVEEVFPDTQL